MPVLPLLLVVTALAVIGPSSAGAQAGPVREVSYEIMRGGQRTVLHLRLQGRQATGTLLEGVATLVLRGTLTGQRLSAELFLDRSPSPIAQLTGELLADQLDAMLQTANGQGTNRLLMRRVGVTAPAAPSGGTLDGRIAGAWQQQTMTTSAGGAGGFASFTTLRTLLLNADGTAQQTMKSVGGGGGWSHRSEPELEFRGRWLTRAGEIWLLVEGETSYQLIAQYQLEADRLVLVGGGKRQVWRR